MFALSGQRRHCRHQVSRQLPFDPRIEPFEVVMSFLSHVGKGKWTVRAKYCYLLYSLK